MTLQEFLNKRETLSKSRENINEQMDKMLDVVKAENREFNADEAKQYAVLEREFKKASRELAMINDNIAAIREKEANAPKQDENAQLREFIRSAKPGQQYSLRASMVTTGATGIDQNVQGLTLKPIIETAFNDKDVFQAAGCPVQTGVAGDKIQWPFAGDVEAVFADELDPTTEKTIDLSNKAATKVRLTVRVRISNQALLDANYDLRSYILTQVSTSLRKKINWAALSTTKAHNSLYGGFAATGKQTGTYPKAGFTKADAAAMINALASKNYPLDNAVFVMGSEEYWNAKVTPMDAGSGIMLLGNDEKILGVPVICNNAINRATQKGAINGHNVGLGLFQYLPVNQYGAINLSVDSSSAEASKTDETIITVNSYWSMTDLIEDAFVVYGKSAN